ncbi:AAA family ATPase [Singulisphaera sp. PoT]|uniref:AAA family ATPase n=1 Tax=Singulisphaera sp. PoT TaxID=3411797 RepID=UPI003BF5DB92
MYDYIGENRISQHYSDDEEGSRIVAMPDPAKVAELASREWNRLLRSDPELAEMARNGARLINRAIAGYRDFDYQLSKLSDIWRDAARAAREVALPLLDTASEDVRRSLVYEAIRRLKLNGIPKLADGMIQEAELWKHCSLDLPSEFLDDRLGQILDMDEFLSEPYQADWLVDGVLQRDQALVIGGQQKSLKTSTANDLAVSLASETPFLGHFPVPHRVRVGMLSAEDEISTLQTSVRQICRAKQVDPRGLGIVFGRKLPDLSDPNQLDALGCLIQAKELEVIIIDPLYLAIMGGKKSKNVNVNSMFEMGRVLGNLTDVCRETGCTPIICHHFRKATGRFGAVPELSNLAHAGLAQFARSWLLLGRRERFKPGEDVHRLHLVAGGSSGYSSLHSLTIDRTPTTDEPDGRWHVTLEEPATHKEGAQGTQGSSTAVQDSADEADSIKLLETILTNPEGMSARKLHEAHKWYRPKFDRILAQLVKDGLVGQNVSGAGTRKSTKYTLTANGQAKIGQKS